MRTKNKLVLAALCALCIPAARAARDIPFTPPDDLVALDRALDYGRARLIAVQDAGRYKTLESFSREAMHAMTGAEHLPKLSPIASALEWIFNSRQYVDAPVILVKPQGLRVHFTAHMPENDDARRRILASGFMTQREFFSRVVQQRKNELAPRAEMNSAMRKVSDAEQVAAALDEMVRLVPPPAEDHASLWHTPQELAPNLAPPAPDGNPRTELGPRVAGISQAQAQSVLLPWASLRAAWLERDAARVQQNLDRLAAALPKLAAPGVYPAEPQRQAEARYYAMGKFTYGWTVYFVAALFSVVALVSGWKTPRYAALALLAVAMAWHAYGVALRWHILGRIPVANVFEAVMAASWAGIALAVLLELVYRMRIFLVAASVTGFFSLIMAQFVIPGGGTITTIQGILDDVMLRIHTVLIVFSYALIFLAAVIALFYLFGYYFVKWPTQSAEAGLITGFAGAALFAISYFAFTRAGLGDAASGYAKGAHVPLAFGGAAIACGAWLALLAARRTSAAALVSASALLLATGATAVGSHGFVRLLAILMLSGGFGWALLTLLGTVLRSRLGEESLALAPAGAGSAPVRAVLSRPIMAGGAPGDETQGDKLPTWLHHFDWCHLILLNLVFVMLFVGTILGAVWADYSWGRPWGWDPKEVFALNTWIVYAILIHVRFLVTERGLWTAWLSIGGCLMMAFNWIFVNYFIVGLHSYA